LSRENEEWLKARDELTESIVKLGFPKELGYEVVKNLGSPKAMYRMNSYLYSLKPNKVELIVDEMLAIKSEIEAWKEKKISEEANVRYNEVLNYGFGEE